MMKRWIATGLMIAAAINLWAQAPEMFRYQGRLLDGTNLVNATLPMSFKLYDALSSGNLVYEDSSSVLVVDGLYSTFIGDNTVFGSLTNAMTNAMVYLELTVNGSTLSPRERLVSVPYALNAGGDATSASTVVLSETYPNPELEAQGYSVVKNKPGSNWEFVGLNPVGSWVDQAIYLSHSGKLWYFPLSEPAPSVWVSEGGLHWVLCTTNIGCDATAGFSVASFNNQLWLTGGSANGVPVDDVWTSSDGTNWTLATDNPGWAPRQRASLAIFDGKLWLIGGCGTTYPLYGATNDVWWTTDGTNWTQATTSAAFEPRANHVTFEFQDKLWMVGGIGMPNEYGYGSIVSRDLWWTVNGTDWTCVGTNTFSALADSPSACVLDEKIYVSGGYEFLLSSADGITWKIEEKGVPYFIWQFFVHDGSLWGADDAIIRSTLIKKEGGFYYYRKD